MSLKASRQLDVKERKYKEQLKKSLSSALAADLYRLLQEELETDVCLHAHSGSIRAHRAVLLARAPHILQRSTPTDPVTDVHLPEYKLPGLKDYLRQVYTSDQSMHSSDFPPPGDDTVLRRSPPPPAADPADTSASSDSDTVVPETASGLGADLLALYQRGEQCDLTIQVEEQVFSCHRAVLCARSDYFRPMLSGSWMESSRHSITLQGLGPDEMEILLQFMYGAIVDLPSGASVSQVASAADMLRLEGLMKVVEMVLTRDYCCFFPKPIGGVKKTIPECLLLAQDFGLQKLHMLCKRWIAEYFVQVWSERNFFLLPPELQRSCFTAVTETITVQNVVTVLCHTEQLICSLPEVKWAQSAIEMAAELQEESLRVIIRNFPRVIRTKPFQNLCVREEFTSQPLLLRKLCTAIANGVTVDNCCDLFAAVNCLCGDEFEDVVVLEQQEQKQEGPLGQELCTLRGRLWTFLVQSFYAIRHTKGWEALSSRHQEKVVADALDEGDSRRLGKKPVLTSSKPRPAKCPPHAPESVALHRTVRPAEKRNASTRGAASAMKSDGLGMANKPGDSPASKAKVAKKPGEKAAAAKTASASVPVVNGTGAVRARRDGASTNGPRSSQGAKEQEKKANPGARPKTCPPSGPPSGPATGTKTPRSSARKADNSAAGGAQPPPGASSKSGSPSPENGAGDAHSISGAKPKQVKAANKSLAAKPPPKSDGRVARGVTNNESVKSTTASAGAAARPDAKGRSTPDNNVSKQRSSVKKPALPKKDDNKDAADKTAGEAPKKKITKSVPASGVPAKPTPKPAKASAAPTKQSSAGAAKSGPKTKNNTELSAEKASPKVRASAAAGPAGSSKGSENDDDWKTVKSDDAPSGNNIPRQVSSELSAAGVSPPASQTGTGPVSEESNPEDTAAQGGDAVPEATLHPAADSGRRVAPAKVEGSKDPGGSRSKPSQGAVVHSHVGAAHGHKITSPNSPRDADRPVDTPCSVESADTPAEDSWSSAHQQVSPESETGSTHTTSSDDIKPRSEDYDAGGSQDDDCSNDRGVSKCGTMRCPDFLGRSSSDTSTPEELKMYEGGAGLRVEVRLRGKEAETTSEEEAGRQRPRSWLQRDEVHVEEEHSDAEVTVKNLPDPQLFSSQEEEEEEEEDEETEDERSEVEVIPGNAPPPPPTDASPHFQGIVNLAFDDDGVDQDNEQPDYQSSSNFRRSVLLSVDECEELGSEEGGAQTPPQRAEDASTPCEVFECDPAAPNHVSHQPDGHKAEGGEGDKSVFLTEVQPSEGEESDRVRAEEEKSDPESRDLPPHERPCHLDLRHTEQYNGMMDKSQAEGRRGDSHLDVNEPQLSGQSPAQSPAGNV